jgi:hypothetical protein
MFVFSGSDGLGLMLGEFGTNDLIFSGWEHTLGEHKQNIVFFPDVLAKQSHVLIGRLAKLLPTWLLIPVTQRFLHGSDQLATMFMLM